MSGNVANGGHEKRDISFQPILYAMIGLFVLIVLVFIGVRATFVGFAHHENDLNPPPNPLMESYGRLQPPEPRLQTAPIKDLHQLRSAEEAQLHGYGWVDRDAGVVHIPIEKAMDLLVQRGLPHQGSPVQKPNGEE